jgi:hypothetical protein
MIFHRPEVGTTYVRLQRHALSSMVLPSPVSSPLPNSNARLPAHDLYARVARGDVFWGLVATIPIGQALLCRSLFVMGCPYTIDVHHVHPVVWGAVRTLLRNPLQGPWEGLQVGPSLCPSCRAQLCTYFRWFRRPAHVPGLSLFHLVVDACHLRAFLRFRMGVNGLPIDTGRWHGAPRSQRACDMCDTGVVGYEHHFVFVCRPSLRLGHAMRHCLHSGPGLCALLFGSPDLLRVVRYIFDCFQVRA